MHIRRKRCRPLTGNDNDNPLRIFLGISESQSFISGKISFFKSECFAMDRLPSELWAFTLWLDICIYVYVISWYLYIWWAVPALYPSPPPLSLSLPLPLLLSVSSYCIPQPGMPHASPASFCGLHDVWDRLHPGLPSVPYNPSLPPVPRPGASRWCQVILFFIGRFLFFHPKKKSFFLGIL